MTAFTYNAYGELSTEANLRTLTRNYDDYGRDVGWALNGSRKNIIEYDGATGRLYRMKAGGAWFTWSYLAGSNLKSQLTYGGSGNTTWEYETNRDLLTRVTNTIYGAVASQYDYVNDLGGRRTQIAKSGTMMAEDEVQVYGYNARDELISGQGQTYNYDDIGNRTVAEGKTYTANNLNQYTAIDTFEPQYDADGNQMLIKTNTGVWSVTYNAENRPVRWESGDVVVTMDFDRMGRRTFYKEEVAGVVTKHHKFVYDNYLCIQKVDALNSNTQINLFVWDPTEPIATRPLFTQRGTGYKFFYTHDGNKNVSELVHFEQRNGIAAHYDYAPFGAVTRAITASAIADNTFATDNPFRFSSEYHDDTLDLVYYNYRHYNPIYARWCGRDPIEEASCVNLFSYVFNSLGVDVLGCSWLGDQVEFMWNGIRLTGRVVTDATVATWNGAYYTGKVVQTYTGSFFMLEASLINGEFFAEMLGDDSHRYLDFSNEDGCNFNISINGMANKDGTAFREAVEVAIQQKVYQLDNENTWTIPVVGSESLGVGDVIQSLWYEVGGQDLLSVHLAEAIQNANERGHVNGCSKICISVYAHSQGTMVARRGFDFLKYVLGAHSDLANVTFCGYGGETSIDAEEFGLRSANNQMNPWDPLIISPRRWGDSFNGSGIGHHSKEYFKSPNIPK